MRIAVEGFDHTTQIEETLQANTPVVALFVENGRGRWMSGMFTVYDIQKALPAAQTIVNFYESKPDSPFQKLPKSGFMRGIDFYSRDQLLYVIAFLLTRHEKLFNDKLDLINPSLFCEKINWAKLFREFKIPESGNKLLTSYFIPENLKGTLSCPEIVWHSPSPILPSNEEIETGDYYFKASHGSGMFKRIKYPLSAIAKNDLEALGQSWLSKPYGIHSGEWFYNVFQRELLLEKAVTRETDSTVLLAYVFCDEIEFISAYQKTPAGDRITRYDKNFDLYPIQANQKRTDPVLIKNDLRERLVRSAIEVSRQAMNMRVDFLIGDDDEVFLNEVTFTSNDGMPFSGLDFDLQLGKKWTEWQNI